MTQKSDKLKQFRFLVILGIFLMTLVTHVDQAHAWLSDYSNRKIITVEADNIDSDLSDFPVYVPITADTDIGGNMQDTTNYYDIRFTDTSDNILPYEEEAMSIAGGSATGHYWVKTDLDDVNGGTIYAYYGKASDTDGSNATSTFDSGFVGVWHLGDGDSTDADFYKDSTRNSNHGQLTDSDGDVTQVSGQLGNSLDFSGDTDRINVGNDSSLDLGSTFTLSGWVNADVFDAGYNFMISKDGPGGNSYDLGFKAGKPYVAINDGSWAEYVSDYTISTDAWHYLAGVRDSGNGLTIYVDGVATSTFASVKLPQDVSGDTTLALRSSAFYEFDGTMDDLRIATPTRSADWIKFEYANMGGQSDYEIALGSEQENIDPSVSTLSPTDGATSVALDANLVITFDEIVDAETGDITLKKSTDDSTVQVFDVTSDISGTGTTEITINPTSNLSEDTAYYVQIDATAFDDTSGNSYAGISDTTTWNFTSVGCSAVENATSLSAYPTCAPLTCSDGYTVDGSVCSPVSTGGSFFSPPSIGSGLHENTIGINKRKHVGIIDYKGNNMLMYIWSQADFLVQLSNESVTSEHSVYVKDVDLTEQTMLVEFQPDSVVLDLDLYETQKVDLNNDGIKDIKVTFSDIIVNRLELTLTDINQNKPISNTEAVVITDTKPTPASEVQKKYEGKLVKYEGDSKVYRIENNKKRWIVSEAVFNFYKYSWADIITIASDVEYLEGAIISKNEIGEFMRNLVFNISGADVKRLQQYLNQKGYIVSKNGVGSPGRETTYFGPKTRAAVSRLQQAQNIFPAYGYFGPLTRAFVNADIR